MADTKFTIAIIRSANRCKFDDAQLTIAQPRSFEVWYGTFGSGVVPLNRFLAC
jgi:hypothetical protein